MLFFTKSLEQNKVKSRCLKLRVHSQTIAYRGISQSWSGSIVDHPSRSGPCGMQKRTSGYLDQWGPNRKREGQSREQFCLFTVVVLKFIYLERETERERERAWEGERERAVQACIFPQLDDRANLPTCLISSNTPLEWSRILGQNQPSRPRSQSCPCVAHCWTVSPTLVSGQSSQHPFSPSDLSGFSSSATHMHMTLQK